MLTLRTQGQEFDNYRFHLCRFGSRELLLPEADVWFTRGDDPVPEGSVYSRTRRSDAVDSLKGYVPGPDDENHPTRRVEGD